MKSIFKTLIEFAFGLHLNLDLKTKNRKGILLEKLLFFPVWPNPGTGPAFFLPFLSSSRAAHPMLACSARLARAAQLAPRPLGLLRFGPSPRAFAAPLARAWPTRAAPSPSRCDPGPACQRYRPLPFPSSSHPFPFSPPPMARARTASHRRCLSRKQAPRSRPSAPLPFLLRRSTPGL